MLNSFKEDSTMLRADKLQENTTEIDGKWVILRPIVQPLTKRLKDALKVLKGDAEAVMFYKQ
jgi:hypothetical protein